MIRLTAKFILKLSDGNFLVCRDLSEEFRYRATIDNYDIEICLNPDFQAYRNFKDINQANNKEQYHGLSKVLIFVTGQEDIEPPNYNRTTHTEYYDYFEKRKKTYSEKAWTALDRTIRFFKYKLRNPSLSTPSQFIQELQNPSWTDSTGREFKSHGITIVGHPLPERMSFGIKCLTIDEDMNLVQSLRVPVETELHEELLADAQTAIFEGNIRRGALEMAIACEVAVKRVFFAKSSTAGEAYEYLESKRKVIVSVPELIDGAAKQAFGESFKFAERQKYESIQHLFECRNKIAHRGEAWYRDKRGTRRELDRETLDTWWKAIEHLLKWLAYHAKI